MPSTPYRFDETLRRLMADRLAAFRPESPASAELKQAAVAIAVAPMQKEGPGGEDEAGFLLTRRVPRLSSHAGQWALPGGRLDPGEDAVAAALREMQEEIGLALPHDHVLGRLDAYPTRSGYEITPVVIWAPDLSDMVANPSEVASIHHFGLSEFDRDGSPEFIDIPESERPVIRLHIGASHIHAPTAAMLYQFAEVALRGRETRVARLEQPVWAWK